MGHAERKILQKELTEFLGSTAFQWDSFCTLTFRRPASLGAINSYAALHGYLREHLPRNGITQSAVFHERGPRGNRPHLHVLSQHPGRLGSDVKSFWERARGWADVKQYNPQLGAAHYVTKYIMKELDDLADWRIYSAYGPESVEDLFASRSRTTGYQLYSRWVVESRGPGTKRR